MHPEFIVRDGVLYVPAWEWNSTEESICGHMLTIVPAPVVFSLSEWDVATQVYLHFGNRWSVELWFDREEDVPPPIYADTVRAASYAANSRLAHLGWQHTYSREPIGPDELLAFVVEVAERTDWEPRSSASCVRPARRAIIH